MKVTREEALNVILSSVDPVKVEESVTLEKAYGRILAVDIFSPVDLPDGDKSAVDGFAFKSSSAPGRFKVIGESPAGRPDRLAVSNGEAVFVMTGGLIPEGADAVVRIEDVSFDGNYVTVDFPVREGNLINYAGSEIKEGERVLKKGDLLDFRKVGLLANLGIYRVKVFRKPRVGVLVTGDEVLEPFEPYFPGSVRNSNYYILKGILERIGVSVIYLGKSFDSVDEMASVFGEALEGVDVLVTTGGVSKGKYDFVKEVVERVGFDVRFTTTNIRPGRPLVFGVKGSNLFFGLPGYPAAMLVNALEFLVPALRKLSGRKEFFNRYLPAVALEDLKSREGRVDFVRVNLEVFDGRLGVVNAGSQQTSNFLSMAMCDGLAVIGADRGTVRKGELVDLLLFDRI